jgi:hypothetical protein
MTVVQHPVISIPETAATRPAAGQPGRFARQSVLFVLIGLVLYLALYVAADQFVYRSAVRNRFFAVRTASSSPYDHVILGASHAAVFDYADMNRQLEQRTGARILNLSVVGGGVVVNRLLLDYFLAEHSTTDVIYILDSFGFYSPQWNEDRLSDTRLIDRAPFDLVLAQRLLGQPATRLVALDYLSGFSKINTPDRFKPDLNEDEPTRFNNTYRPVRQIDTQRLRYLYPERVDQAILTRYLGELRSMLDELRSRRVGALVIKPPLPERVYRLLPEEAEFDAAIRGILVDYGVAFHDLSLRCNEERFFYNTDHLNRAGVLNFYDECLVPVLVGQSAG